MAGTADIDIDSVQRSLEVESAFVGAMDATDTYVGSYEQLHGRLKEVSLREMSRTWRLRELPKQILLTILQAFFELARARYAMGVHSISPAQFSSQLEASKRVRLGNHGAEASLLILEEDDQESVILRRRSLSLNNKQSQDEEGKLSDAQACPCWSIRGLVSEIDLQLRANFAAALQGLRRSGHLLQGARVCRGSTKARTAS